MYIVDDQEDLTITFNWYEDLTGYTGKIKYYLIPSGTSSASTSTATVSAASTLSTVSYAVADGGAIFDDPGEWSVWAEVTSSTGKVRSCRPHIVEISQIGIP